MDTNKKILNLSCNIRKSLSISSTDNKDTISVSIRHKPLIKYPVKICATRWQGEYLKGDHTVKVAAREFSDSWTAEDWQSFEEFCIKILQ